MTAPTGISSDGPSPAELHEVQRSATRPARYVRPDRLETVLDLLAEHGDRARVVAGGTDLLVELDRGMRPHVDLLVDLSSLDGLDSIHRSRQGIHLGPLVTHNQCVASELLREHALPLAQACWEVGSPALRNRATVVGNIVTASPANDSLSALVALDAEVSMASARGVRTVPIGAFTTGVRATVLASDEVVTGITIPVPDVVGERRGVYLKLGLRRAQAISVVHLAAMATVGQDGSIDDARIVLGSVAPTVRRITAAEAAFEGVHVSDGRIDGDQLEGIARAAATAVQPIDDLRASADYRIDQISVMVRRAVSALVAGTHGDAFPVEPPMIGGPVVGAGATSESWAVGDQLELAVDGRSVSAPWRPVTLLQWLRDDVDVTSVKEGCAEGECGACTVQLDGVSVLSCLVPAARAAGCAVTTAAGVGTETTLAPIQQSFIDHAAVQCGYCIPGFIVAADALRSELPSPTDQQIKQGLAGNLCRCTGYYKIEAAVR